MALITRLERMELERDAPHRHAACTYSMVPGPKGSKLLQVDTYGSAQRKLRGKKSQSIRMSTDVIRELLEILRAEKMI